MDIKPLSIKRYIQHIQTKRDNSNIRAEHIKGKLLHVCNEHLYDVTNNSILYDFEIWGFS